MLRARAQPHTPTHTHTHRRVRRSVHGRTNASGRSSAQKIPQTVMVYGFRIIESGVRRTAKGAKSFSIFCAHAAAVPS